jgi:hypothetical protein
VFEAVAGDAAEPIVGQQAIEFVVGAYPVGYSVGKLINDLGEVFFGEVKSAGRNVDHAKSGFYFDYFGQVGGYSAYKYGGLPSGLGEGGDEFSHVDVHAAAVSGAGLNERRRVERKYG